MSPESSLSALKWLVALAALVGAIFYIRFRSSDCEAHGGSLVMAPWGFKCLRAEEVK